MTIDQWTCILVRHASAGDRRLWAGDDNLRPLDDKGVRQAQQLVSAFAPFGIERVISADPIRCVQTVEPFARSAGLEVRPTRVFSERGYADDSDTALDTWIEICTSGVPTVVSSQGGAIPDMMERCFLERGWMPARDPFTKKGAYWVITMEAGSPIPAGVELVPNPA